MKQGWEYKKLGEVCEVVSGSTPKTNVPEYWGKGHYWVTPAELNETIVYIDKTERQITDEALAKTKLRLLPVGTVLLSSRAPIGKVAITKTEMYCNQGFKNCICSDSIYNKYLFYFLRLKKEYLNSLGRGATFKEISKSIVESISIPLPPKSTQLAIVSELDKINELIRLKKEQLKDFDNLAQSIFYEMFGDPVENEMGWEVKKLGDVCTFSQGMQVPIEKQKVMQHEGYVRFLRIIDFTQGKDAPRYVECDNDKYILHEKEIAIVRYGTPGFVCTGLVGAIANNLFKLNPISDNTFIFEYLVHWLSSSAFQSSIKGRQYGAALQAIKFSTIQNINILIPPLPLQHLFAQRIEQIEHQKAEVQKSIADLETLLASRMLYWFE